MLGGILLGAFIAYIGFIIGIDAKVYREQRYMDLIHEKEYYKEKADKWDKHFDYYNKGC